MEFRTRCQRALVVVVKSVMDWFMCFFFSSRRRHTRFDCDWSSDVCSSDLVDTIGACGPEAVEFLVRQVREWVGPQVPLHFHGHNDFGMATACAVAAVRAGEIGRASCRERV